VSNPEPVQNRALEELVSRYSRLIRSAVRRVAGPISESVADDIEQKVLIALWQAMPGEQIPDHPSSYLYRAAVRETVRTLKRRRLDASELVEDHRDPQPAPDRLAESSELGAAIGRALSTLTEDRRRAVKSHLMGFDVREIMTMQGWPYNKARNLIARGMADLRRELVKRGVRG
jgi:RNA polymerase sigma factor (sigma-70 family)